MASKTPKQHRAMRAAAAGKGNRGIPAAKARAFLANDSSSPRNASVARASRTGKNTRGKRPGQS